VDQTDRDGAGWCGSLGNLTSHGMRVHVGVVVRGAEMWGCEAHSGRGCGSAQVSWKDVQVEASVLCSTGENFNSLSLGAAFKINLLNLSIGISFH